MTRVLTLLLAALLALPIAAEAQKPIKVGMPMPLSGPPALFGEPATKGAQMYVCTSTRSTPRAACSAGRSSS